MADGGLIAYLRSFSPIVFLDLVGCEKNKGWMVGGFLPEVGSYQWVYTNTAEGVNELLYEDFAMGEIVTGQIVLPEKVCDAQESY